MFLVRKVGCHTGEQVHCVPDGGRLCGGQEHEGYVGVGTCRVVGVGKNVGVGT